MFTLDPSTCKRTFTTHTAPDQALTRYTPLRAAPQIGDLVVGEVLRLGKHSSVEDCDGLSRNIFPGDRLIGAFGCRYATDQYEGYVPDGPVDECDMLSVGGVFGKVVSWHTSMGTPTRLKLLGTICNEHGQPVNLRSFAPAQVRAVPQGEVILVVGSSMNSGKTTTVGTLARSLSRRGLRVAAAKVTGTAAGKDGRFFESCGANPVLDFTDCGFPSTYMLGRGELLELYTCLLNRLYATNPDFILIEIADGIFQRETRMLLESPVVRSSVDHLFFTAGDSLGAECGVRHLLAEGWPLRAVSGLLTCSPLSMREAEEHTHMPCLDTAGLLSDRLLEVLGTQHAIEFGGVQVAYHAV